MHSARLNKQNAKNRVSPLNANIVAFKLIDPLGSQTSVFARWLVATKSEIGLESYKIPETIAHAFRVRVKNVLKAGRMQRSAVLLG